MKELSRAEMRGDTIVNALRRVGRHTAAHQIKRKWAETDKVMMSDADIDAKAEALNTLDDYVQSLIHPDENKIDDFSEIYNVDLERKTLLARCEKSRVFVISPRQAQVFADMVYDDNCVEEKIRGLPFSTMCFNFEKSIDFPCFDDGVRAIIFDTAANTLVMIVFYDGGGYSMILPAMDDGDILKEWMQNKSSWDFGDDKAGAIRGDTTSQFLKYLVSFVNASNTNLSKICPNSRRRKKSTKRELKDYITVNLDCPRTDYLLAGGTGEGSSHGYRYDVRGHFRQGHTRTYHLKDGSTKEVHIGKRWIAAHQGGLDNDIYIPHHYEKKKG